MNGCLGGCVGRAFGLLLLVGFGVAAWLWGPRLLEEARGDGFPLAERLPFLESLGGSSGSGSAGPPPSPALAEEAESRLEVFLQGGEGSISLSAPELESLLRYRLVDTWPEGVSPPSVTLRDGELELGLRLARERLPSLPELESVLAFLPDTVPVALKGRVVALGSGEAALLVHRVEASAIPIPRRFYARILESVRGAAPPDLPPEALYLPLPGGIRSAVVQGDRLVLERGS
jgi:hypothetical protein